MNGPVRLAHVIRRRRQTPAIALLVGSVSACLSLLEPNLPEGAEEMDPPPVYARWWRLTEACSGHSRGMETVRWYRTPGLTFRLHNQVYSGVWIGNRIVIAGDEVYDGRVVRHEMLHALLETGGHPRAQFLGACASLVACGGSCVEDAGQWKHPSNYELQTPDSLDVSVELELAPAEADGERWLVAWVSAHNRRDRAIVVSAPGGSRWGETFVYQLWGPFGGIQNGLFASDSSMLFFGPSETKRMLFEFRRGPALSQYTVPIVIPPGAYRAWAAYARHWSEVDASCHCAITVPP